MSRRHVISLPAIFAGLTGFALVSWWAATLLDGLPTDIRPAQQQASHVAAELILAVALLVGAVLYGRGARSGRLVLSAALGALVYASVNVLSDFPQSRVMTVLLAGAAGLSAAVLVIVVFGSEPRRDRR